VPKINNLEVRVDKLEKEMHAGIARLDNRIDKLEEKVDTGFARIDARIDNLVKVNCLKE
jgi:tetrahydromethanopterin S-methyltransferase subunit G